MEDNNSAVIYRVGTHRIRTPEETLARVVPHMSAMGITRIADVTGLDTLGIPVVMVCRPNSRSVSLSQGKGYTLAAARASGLMESVEGFHAEHMTRPLHIASKRDMQGFASTVAIEQLPPMRGSLFHDDYPITWVEADDLLGLQPLWLPYEMVHTNYTDPRPSGSGCFPASSNGLASGNTLVEATVHGICEVIERDAISLWHQSGKADVDRTSVDPNTITSPLVQETLDKLTRVDQQTFIWDITSDTRVATYFCVIVDQTSGTQHIGVGSGTHLSKEVALLRALHEAVQVRTTYIVGARDDIRPDEYTQEGIRAKNVFFENIIRRCTFSSDYPRTADLDSGNVEEDLKMLLSCLRRIGLSHVLRVDLCKPEFDIPVARIVIPGLEAPHDEQSYIPGPRALRIRQGAR
ncbi:MAG: YcaO-like family protein [Granulosicoccus sp.]